MNKIEQSIKKEIEGYAKYVPFHVAVRKVKSARLNRHDREADKMAKQLEPFYV